MIPKQQFINKLRKIGYTYKTTLKRVDLYRRGTHFIPVRRNDNLSEEFCVSSLRQALCTEEEIRDFIKDARA